MKQIPLELQKMEMIGRLSTSVIHDLNNMLTVIQLNAALLEIGELEEGESSRLVNEINQACSCASDLTRSVLSFSRRSDHSPTRFELGKTLADISPILSVLSGKKTNLTIDCPAEKIWIEGSAVEFQQIILNLISNGIDAGPKSGLRLAIESVFSEEDQRRFVQIIVQDTGKGIAPEDLPNIFKAFFTTKEQGRGTGLGLYIVQRIVTERGGSLKVESVLHEGTTFRLRLPQASAEAEKLPVDLPIDSKLDITILLVEDDAGIRAIGRQILEREGARVFEAVDAEQAMKIWREHGDVITVLFTDIVLPGKVYGDQLASQLVQEKSDLKVLYTSGNISAAQRSPDFSKANFLHKPYRPEALIQAVSRLLV